jgi:hypothetical protein
VTRPHRKKPTSCVIDVRYNIVLTSTYIRLFFVIWLWILIKNILSFFFLMKCTWVHEYNCVTYYPPPHFFKSRGYLQGGKNENTITIYIALEFWHIINCCIFFLSTIQMAMFIARTWWLLRNILFIHSSACVGLFFYYYYYYYMSD